MFFFVVWEKCGVFLGFAFWCCEVWFGVSSAWSLRCGDVMVEAWFSRVLSCFINWVADLQSWPTRPEIVSLDLRLSFGSSGVYPRKVSIVLLLLSHLFFCGGGGLSGNVGFDSETLLVLKFGFAWLVHSQLWLCNTLTSSVVKL